MSRFTKATTVIAVMGAALFGGAGMAAADAGAQGAAIGSPGVLSGNLVQIPVHIPINVCGNTVNGIGALNPAFGNSCENSSSHHMTGDDSRGGDKHGPSGGPRQHGQQAGQSSQSSHSQSRGGKKDHCDH